MYGLNESGYNNNVGGFNNTVNGQQQQQQQGGGGAFGSAFGSGFGGEAAQNMLLDIGKQNFQQYMKVGEQSFLSNYVPFVKDLRQYFRVDHQYVRRKTALLFAPFMQKKIARGSALSDHAFIGGGSSSAGHGGAHMNNSQRPSAIRSASAAIGGVNTQYNFGDDGGFGGGNFNHKHTSGSPPPPQVTAGGLTSPNVVSPSSNFDGSPNNNNATATNSGANFKMPTPQEDVLAPDLYIPSMAVLTYVALCGFIRGLTDDSLAPEFLATMLWSLIVWELLEVAAVMIASYALMTPLATLDALALAGYKHVGVCVLLLLREVTGLRDSYLFLVPVLYVAGCAVLFAYNTIKMFIARRGDGTVHVRSMPLLYGWAGVQAFFVFWFAMKPF